jgi:hypothetical protein
MSAGRRLLRRSQPHQTEREISPFVRDHDNVTLRLGRQPRLLKLSSAPPVAESSRRSIPGETCAHSVKTEKELDMLATVTRRVALGAILMAPVSTASPVQASSHMDAPLITLDNPANTTDVYAFKSRSGGVDYLTTALAVYPFEEPGIGPNNYRFDPAVDYEIHVALGTNTIQAGKADLTYRFEFSTNYANRKTILQSYLGVIEPGPQFSANQNVRNTYKLVKIDNRTGTKTVLGDNLMVPPNNQGRVTPFYNQDDNGDNPARGGVGKLSDLDGYTRNAIMHLPNGYRSFAGQRDDGFYGDIQSIFDLDFTFDKPAPFDSQGGYNVHTIVLNIPLSELGAAKIAGVYATTSRHEAGERKQVGRQGNPLFVEALIAIKDKDQYNQTPPTSDAANFSRYADKPELSAVLGVTPIIPGLLKSIFIPDLIKVDLTTPPARLSGEPGFHRLGVFGGDTLKSKFQDPFGNGGFIPGGWPNGRRFGDDVIDIAIIALGAAGPGPDFSSVNADKVTDNDITYNRVFPYAATPLNGRVHTHHGL